MGTVAGTRTGLVDGRVEGLHRGLGSKARARAGKSWTILGQDRQQQHCTVRGWRRNWSLLPPAEPHSQQKTHERDTGRIDHPLRNSQKPQTVARGWAPLDWCDVPQNSGSLDDTGILRTNSKGRHRDITKVTRVPPFEGQGTRGYVGEGALPGHTAPWSMLGCRRHRWAKPNCPNKRVLAGWRRRRIRTDLKLVSQSDQFFARPPPQNHPANKPWKMRFAFGHQPDDSCVRRQTGVIFKTDARIVTTCDSDPRSHAGGVEPD